MGISARCVEWLRTQGHDAMHLFEQGLHNLTDSEVLHKANAEKRILLTMDLDFARLIAGAGTAELPTVIIFRLSNQRPQNVQNRLIDLFPLITESIKKGSSVLSVSDTMVRIRYTPVK